MRVTTEPSGHPRSLKWVGVSALALGGSNQSLFILPVLLLGHDAISGQGSAAVLLLMLGLLLAWAALPGWIELVLLSPNRVGGIAASCTAAFRPYSPAISAIAGCGYWWGWIPTCGFTAIVAASALHEWILPWVPTRLLGVGFVACFFAINLCGIKRASRVAVPLALTTIVLSFLAAFVPIVTGRVDWHRATSFHLTSPFAGWFGEMTSLMAGLYLIGFVAPAFEAAACYVGETIDPARNVPRSMLTNAGLSALYFVVIPIVFLGMLGPSALGSNLAVVLGPQFAPAFGSLGKAFVVGFVVFNMLHGAFQPLAGASRTLAQLADDGIFPRFLARRSARDVPWAATTLTAAAASAFLILGDPLWLVASTNFTYLISICLPTIAVWLLRRDAPQLTRLFCAPRGTIALGLGAALIWTLSAILGFEQFGLVTVMLGLIFAYSGAGLYAWRKIEDHHRAGFAGVPTSLHLRLTETMIAILLADGVGYYVAIQSIPGGDAALVTLLQDLFVLVAMLTIGVGFALPGLIAHAATRELIGVNASLREGTETLEREIRVRKDVEQQLLQVAFHDELTGLANRALFMERLAQTSARVQRTPDRLAAVLFLDLDRFKLINDSLGHQAGDLLLVAVAKRLEACLAPGDTLARLGGDEFTFLLEGVKSDAEAREFAERVLAALAPPFTILAREIFATASIGIAVVRTGRNASADVLRDADIAMYRAKGTGRHRCMLFAPEFFEQAVSLLQMESDLKGALERREFVLHYQPIVALATNDLIGFEALIRWQHPERGLIFPDAFIPAAEESDTIAAIGAFVFEEAACQARLWRDQFGFARPLAISVNVSAQQFAKLGLLDEIRNALGMFDLSSAHLHVEITESAIMVDPEMATKTLTELRNIGIEVHLDDFGTGYSSLGYLQRFPVSTLKIDRSFVSMGGKGISNPQIVSSITSLAHSLSIKTTAEGIETLEQLEQLRAMHCTNGQGYYFSRPMTAVAATTAIANWRRAEIAQTTTEPLRFTVGQVV